MDRARSLSSTPGNWTTRSGTPVRPRWPRSGALPHIYQEALEHFYEQAHRPSRDTDTGSCAAVRVGSWLPLGAGATGRARPSPTVRHLERRVGSAVYLLSRRPAVTHRKGELPTTQLTRVPPREKPAQTPTQPARVCRKRTSSCSCSSDPGRDCSSETFPARRIRGMGGTMLVGVRLH